MKRVNKRGTILVENIIFIVLNLIFLTILILFIARQGEGAIVLEEAYAKEIAMVINSAKPEMTLRFDMKEGFELAEKNGVGKKDIVRISGNIVRVRLTNVEGGGYSYSFFNDVVIENYFPVENDDDYVVIIGGYKNVG